ncbi:putative SbcC ATPase [Pseudomonas phage OBP]|uniref:putative SbcC ATPase n=1 Tax=Pseudomonas phage OBP TaxID=1124849 RepID=UPI000240D568|nr:putative SbcC ATPase [Pseudomonas phage OBP]AEV89584.1 putative SbcC ATPase [Pseudomonas phage OBP]
MLVKLILKNYIPLAKKNVTYIELNTKDVFNIILGRNGFGKTSLMRQLTVYPPDNADYMQGGYKESHHVIGKNNYILKSTTGKSSEHHFIHNGKELNEGNTLLVQRELVKIHFGVTPAINNVITGLDVRDLFTTLSTARRKDFLMAVNPNDTSYALKVFERLKSNLNSIKGGLKTQRQRLVVEEGRLSQLAAMDSDKLNEEIRVLDDQIKNALLIHGELSNIQHEDIVDLRTEIGNILSFLIGANHSVKHGRHQLLRMKEQCEGTFEYYKSREIRYSTTLTELTSQLSGLDLGNNNLDSYRQRLAVNQTAIELNTAELETLQNRFDKHPIFNEIMGDEKFYHIAEELISSLHSVNRARDADITSSRYAAKVAELNEIKIERDNKKNQATEIRHTLAHFNKADLINCPKCETKFKLGFENIDLNKLNHDLETIETRLNELQERYRLVNDYVDANEGWYESMMGLSRYARRTEYPAFITKIIGEYRVGKTDISVLIDLIRSTVAIADVKKTLAVLEEENKNVETQIKFLESSNVELLFKRAAWVERELASVQNSSRRVLKQIEGIDDQLGTIILDAQKRDRLGYLMEELEGKVINNGKNKIRMRVADVITELTPRKSQLISNLIRAESLNSVIQSIKDNIADLERREKHTALLMDGLSPTKGIIGYLMNDFLKSVVANVNAIIQPIWTNRLSVLNCSTSKSDEDVDLSYNFPLISGASDKTSKDIAEGSGGEREIINFAFRLVLRRYLGDRCSIPLMMDEVGVAFDELHKGRFSAYIAEQLRLDKLPQTFMISHNYKEYASHADANIIALNTDGIRVGFEVNKKSVIK